MSTKNETSKTYLNVYGSIDRGRGKSSLVKVGAMFPHKEGKGYTIILDALPRNIHETGELVVFPPRERDDASEEEGA